MADQNPDEAAFAAPAFAEDDVRRGIELIYFGYSHLTRAADARLSDKGLGRAHHRALYFIARQPGMIVGDLMRLLNITKQSLARVLADLTRDGLIEARADTADRRQRTLHLTESGAALEGQLYNDLRTRLHAAYAGSGTAAVSGYWDVLEGLIPPDDLTRIRAIQNG